MKSNNKILFSYIDELAQFDNNVVIVLKGHLLAEQLMNESIDEFVIHPSHIKKLGLRFEQKMKLCKSISQEQDESVQWDVLKKLNETRNALAHSLDEQRKERVLENLRQSYDKAFPNTKIGMPEFNKTENTCLSAVITSLGFLQRNLDAIISAKGNTQKA